MSLWESPYVSDLRELLACMDQQDLMSLSSTASAKRLLPETSKEAIEIILRYTENLGRLFSYRRMTTQVLFQYLHRKNVPVMVSVSKNEMIDIVKDVWEKSLKQGEKRAAETSSIGNHTTRSPFKDGCIGGGGGGGGGGRANMQSSWGVNEQQQQQQQQQQQPSTCSLTLNIAASTASAAAVNMNLYAKVGMDMRVEVSGMSSGSDVSSGGGVRSDVFTNEFCRWFYTMVNRLQPEFSKVEGDTFSSDIFVANSSVDIYLYGHMTTERHAQGQQDTYVLLRDTFNEFAIYFSPNLENGTRIEMSAHGLAKVYCCGTLHHKDSVVGIFEQEFGLVRCPPDYHWKIMSIKINLKQAHGVTKSSLPVLTQGEVFTIPP